MRRQPCYLSGTSASLPSQPRVARMRLLDHSHHAAAAAQLRDNLQDSLQHALRHQDISKREIPFHRPSPLQGPGAFRPGVYDLKRSDTQVSRHASEGSSQAGFMPAASVEGSSASGGLPM